MKKFIMLSAVMAAVSTAFVACSSDDDLAQAPAVPEETVSEGIPFSVVAFNTDDTRAVRYNADGEGVNPDGTTPSGEAAKYAFVKSFKLYGKQVTAGNTWIDNLIFARTAKTGDGSKFSPARDNAGEAFVGTLTWPTTNTDQATTFYAITDNDIATGSGNTISNVTWNPGSSNFTYTMPTKSETIEYIEYSDALDVISASKTVVDADALRDLMVATAEKTAATAPTNAVGLSFDHVMSGLAINAWFVSGQADLVVPATVSIKSVMVCGLKGTSTYTFGSGFGDKTIPVIYYKKFSPAILATKQPVWDDPDKKTGPHWDSDHTLYELVKPGEWLVIPQECTPWNRSVNDDDFPSMTGAFISLLINDGNKDALISFPLTTNAAHKEDVTNTPLSSLPATLAFNPGKTRTININIALGREHALTSGTADFCWEPGTFDVH